MSAPVLRWPGSKWSIAHWIIEHIPPHIHYLEPFFGSGAVFFCKRPSRIETINDIDKNVVNLFKVIRSRPEEIAELIEMTPWARDEYYDSYEQTGDELEDARRFLVRCWQAYGAKTSHRAGWRSDVRISSNASRTKTWRNLPTRILAVADRLRDAQIENQPAAQIIKRFSSPEVLIYADPPYLLSTRSQRQYKHEMDDKDHLELLNLLDAHPGPVLLSGYDCPLYNDRLRHWVKRTKITVAEKGRYREEVLWINPVAARGLSNLRLFGEI